MKQAMDPKTFQLIQEMRQVMKKPKTSFTRVETKPPSTTPSETSKPYFVLQEYWSGRWEPTTITRTEPDL